MHIESLCKGGFERLRQSHKYLVIRELFQPWSYEDAIFPVRKYGFTVVPGSRFTPQISDIAEKFASAETKRLGLKDDLGVVDPFEPDSLKAHIYRLTHAIEHLVAVDLIDRRVVELPPLGITYYGATTIAYTRSDAKGVDGEGFSFFVRNGLVSDEEETISVSNVISKVNLLLCEVL